MKPSFFASMVNYLSFLCLGGAIFFGFVFLKIKVNPPFLKLNLKKIKENHSDISIFMTSLLFIICFSFCLYYRNKKPNETLIDSPEPTFVKKKPILPILKGRDMFFKQQYLLENYENEEKKTLIGCLDDNENF